MREIIPNQQLREDTELSSGECIAVLSYDEVIALAHCIREALEITNEFEFEARVDYSRTWCRRLQNRLLEIYRSERGPGWT